MLVRGADAGPLVTPRGVLLGGRCSPSLVLDDGALGCVVAGLLLGAELPQQGREGLVGAVSGRPPSRSQPFRQT